MGDERPDQGKTELETIRRYEWWEGALHYAGDFRASGARTYSLRPPLHRGAGWWLRLTSGDVAWVNVVHVGGPPPWIDEAKTRIAPLVEPPKSDDPEQKSEAEATEQREGTSTRTHPEFLDWLVHRFSKDGVDSHPYLGFEPLGPPKPAPNFIAQPEVPQDEAEGAQQKEGEEEKGRPGWIDTSDLGVNLDFIADAFKLPGKDAAKKLLMNVGSARLAELLRGGFVTEEKPNPSPPRVPGLSREDLDLVERLFVGTYPYVDAVTEQDVAKRRSRELWERCEQAVLARPERLNTRVDGKPEEQIWRWIEGKQRP